ncbi:hypothetical protein FKM82_014998 [Ascaphus truei]
MHAASRKIYHHLPIRDMEVPTPGPHLPGYLGTIPVRYFNSCVPPTSAALSVHLPVIHLLYVFFIFSVKSRYFTYGIWALLSYFVTDSFAITDWSVCLKSCIGILETIQNSVFEFLLDFFHVDFTHYSNTVSSDYYFILIFSVMHTVPFY